MKVYILQVAKLVIFSIALVFTSTSLAANYKTLIANAQLFVKHQNYEAAYRTLHAASDEFAGDPDFDYLLGIAASKTNNLGEAVIALDRAVIVNPSNGEAVLLRAIVYYQMKNYDEAKAEFLKIKRSNPPPTIAKVVDRYLDFIENGAPSNNRHSFNVGLDFGYNSNVNTSQNDTIKMLGSDVLTTKLQSLGSTFNTLKFNWNSNWFLNPDWSLNTGVFLANQFVHFSTKVPQQEIILSDYTYLIAVLYTDANYQINKFNKLNFGLNFNEVVSSMRYEHLNMGLDLHINYTNKILDNLSYTVGLASTFNWYNKFGKNSKTKKDWSVDDRISAVKNNTIVLTLKNNFRYFPMENLVLLANVNFIYEKAPKVTNENSLEGFEIRSGGDLLATKASLAFTYYITSQHSVGAELGYKLSYNLKEDFNFQNEGKGNLNRIQNNVNFAVYYDYIPFDFMKVNLSLDSVYNKSNIKYFDYLQFIPKVGIDFYF